MRRLLAGLALSASLLVVAAPVASAHECYIANRSAQGDASALKSGRWQRLGLADIFGFIHDAVGGRPLTAEEIEQAIDIAADQGLPRDGWVIRSDRVIGNGPNLHDGRGVDHIVGSFGDQIVGIYLGIVFPA